MALMFAALLSLAAVLVPVAASPAAAADDFRLVTVSTTRSDGWALYDIGGQTHRQWVDNACRNQLVAAGATLDIVNYSAEIGIHPKTTAWKNCNQLAELVGVDDGPDDPGSEPTRKQVVKGTLGSTPWSLGPNPTGNANIDQPAHGSRIYCTVSHLSYDDPVVFPNQPGAAHLHTFWGNSLADATTTTSASLAGGATSCEGGVNNQSSYWMPTLFDAQGRAVLPESIFVYYKSFFSGAYNGNRHLIQPVPNGLQMLANKAIPDHGDSFRTNPHDGKVQLVARFPNCLQVHGNGSPVLSSNVGGARDRNAHLAYANASNGTPNECPTSHPYRIPSLEYIVRYDVPNGSNWSLSSDMGGQNRGATLHADYIARWDQASMNALVRCNRDMRPQCEFGGSRSQLPDRFVAPDGTRVYTSSASLIGSRTPYGTSLPKMN